MRLIIAYVLAAMAGVLGTPAAMSAAATPTAGAAPAARAAASTTLVTRNPLNQLRAVSCPRAADCMAVGANIAPANGVPLAELWRGTRWQAVPVTLPSGATGAQLYGVSCKPGRCVAVGDYHQGSASYPLAELWNGSTWTAAKPAMPSGAAGGFLASVSCATADSCVAVGSYQQESGVTAPISEAWNGTSWTASKPPSLLNGISCVSAKDCVAVGGYRTGNVSSLAADSWNGAGWKQTWSQRVPGASQASLDSVSCPSAASCAAVGTTVSAGYQATGISAVLAGRAWKVISLSWPGGGDQSDLQGIACASATRCLAVGEIILPAAHLPVAAAAQTWNGRSWTRTTLPAPPTGIDSQFYADTCPPAASCVAVGDTGPDYAGTTTWPAWHGLSGFWTGTNWTLQTTT
jgi:hypothetical protein